MIFHSFSIDIPSPGLLPVWPPVASSASWSPTAEAPWRRRHGFLTDGATRAGKGGKKSGKKLVKW